MVILVSCLIWCSRSTHAQVCSKPRALCTATDGHQGEKKPPIQTDTHVYMQDYTETPLDLRREAKRMLGNDKPTHFLSILAVNYEGLEHGHAEKDKTIYLLI